MNKNVIVLILLIVFAMNLAAQQDAITTKFQQKVETIVFGQVLAGIRETDYDMYRLLYGFWHGVKNESTREVKQTLVDLMIEKGFVYGLYFSTRQLVRPAIACLLFGEEIYKELQKEAPEFFLDSFYNVALWKHVAFKEFEEFYPPDKLSQFVTFVLQDKKRLKLFKNATSIINEETPEREELLKLYRDMVIEFSMKEELNFAPENSGDMTAYLKRLENLARLFDIQDTVDNIIKEAKKIPEKSKKIKDFLKEWYVNILQEKGYEKWLVKYGLTNEDLDAVYLEVLSFLIRMAVNQNKEAKFQKGVGNFNNLSRVIRKIYPGFSPGDMTMDKLLNEMLRIQGQYSLPLELESREFVKEVQSEKEIAGFTFWHNLYNFSNQLITIADDVVDIYKESASFFESFDTESVKKIFLQIWNVTLPGFVPSYMDLSPRIRLDEELIEKTVQTFQLSGMIADYIQTNQQDKLIESLGRLAYVYLEEQFNTMEYLQNRSDMRMALDILFYAADISTFSEFKESLENYIYFKTGEYDFSKALPLLVKGTFFSQSEAFLALVQLIGRTGDTIQSDLKEEISGLLVEVARDVIAIVDKKADIFSLLSSGFLPTDLYDLCNTVLNKKIFTPRTLTAWIKEYNPLLASEIASSLGLIPSHRELSLFDFLSGNLINPEKARNILLFILKNFNPQDERFVFFEPLYTAVNQFLYVNYYRFYVKKQNFFDKKGMNELNNLQIGAEADIDYAVLDNISTYNAQKFEAFTWPDFYMKKVLKNLQSLFSIVSADSGAGEKIAYYIGFYSIVEDLGAIEDLSELAAGSVSIKNLKRILAAILKSENSAGYSSLRADITAVITLLQNTIPHYYTKIAIEDLEYFYIDLMEELIPYLPEDSGEKVDFSEYMEPFGYFFEDLLFLKDDLRYDVNPDMELDEIIETIQYYIDDYGIIETIDEFLALDLESWIIPGEEAIPRETIFLDEIREILEYLKEDLEYIDEAEYYEDVEDVILTFYDAILMLRYIGFSTFIPGYKYQATLATFLSAIEYMADYLEFDADSVESGLSFIEQFILDFDLYNTIDMVVNIDDQKIVDYLEEAGTYDTIAEFKDLLDNIGEEEHTDDFLTIVDVVYEIIEDFDEIIFTSVDEDEGWDYDVYDLEYAIEELYYFIEYDLVFESIGSIKGFRNIPAVNNLVNSLNGADLYEIEDIRALPPLVYEAIKALKDTIDDYYLESIVEDLEYMKDLVVYYERDPDRGKGELRYFIDSEDFYTKIAKAAADVKDTQEIDNLVKYLKRQDTLGDIKLLAKPISKAIEKFIEVLKERTLEKVKAEAADDRKKSDGHRVYNFKSFSFNEFNKKLFSGRLILFPEFKDVMDNTLPVLGVKVSQLFSLLVDDNRDSLLLLLTSSFKEYVMNNIQKLAVNVKEIIMPFMDLAIDHLLYGEELDMKEVVAIAGDVLETLGESQRAFLFTVGFSLGLSTANLDFETISGASVGKMYISDKLGLDFIGLATDLHPDWETLPLRFGVSVGGFIDYLITELAGLETINETGGANYIKTMAFLGWDQPDNEALSFDVSFGMAWDFDFNYVWTFNVSWNVLNIMDFF